MQIFFQTFGGTCILNMVITTAGRCLECADLLSSNLLLNDGVKSDFDMFWQRFWNVLMFDVLACGFGDFG